jgi:hypothetical protein
MDSSSKRKQGSRQAAPQAEGLEERRLLSGRVLDFKFVYHGKAAEVGTPTSAHAHPNATKAIAQRAALRFAAASAEASKAALLAAKHPAIHALGTAANSSSTTSTTTSATNPPSSPTAPTTTPTPAGATTTSATIVPVSSPPTPTPTPPPPPAPVVTAVAQSGTMLPAGSAAAMTQLWSDEQAIQAKSHATVDMVNAISKDIQTLATEVRIAPGQSQLQTLGSDLTAAASATPTTGQLTAIQVDYTAMLNSMGVTDSVLIAKTFNDVETYVSATGITAADIATLAADLTAAGLPANTTMPGDLSCTLPGLLIPTAPAPGQVVFRIPPTNMPTNVTSWTSTS